MDTSKQSAFDQCLNTVKASGNTLYTHHNTFQEFAELKQLQAELDQLTPEQITQLHKKYANICYRVNENSKSLTAVISKKPIHLESLAVLRADLPQLVRDKQLVAMTAMMSTGKTQHVIAPLCAYLRSIGLMPVVINHRQKLSAELTKRCGTIIYDDVKVGGVVGNYARAGAETQGITICINSLVNPNVQDLLEANSHRIVVIVDEAEQTADTLNDKTLSDTSWKGANRRKVFNAFVQVLSCAQSVFIADADLTDNGLGFYEYATSKTAVIFHAKKDLSKRTVNVNLYSGRDERANTAGLTAIIAALESGKKCFVCCNRRKMAIGIGEILKRTGKRILVIHSKSVGNDAIRFRDDAEATSLDFDCIVISPSITSGVSVDNPDYTHCFAFYNNSTITHFAAIQQMARFRNVQHTEIILSVSDCSSGTEISCRHVDYIANLKGRQLEGVLADDALGQLLKNTSTKRAASIKNFAQVMIWRLRDMGHKVTVSREFMSGERDKESAISQFISELNEKEREAILGANDINGMEHKALSVIDEPTEEQAAQVQRYEVKAALYIPEDQPLTDEQFELFADGHGISSLRRLFALTGHLDVEKHHQREVDGDVPLGKRKNYLAQRNLFNALLCETYGDMVDISDFIAGDLPQLDKAEIRRAADFIERTALNGVMIGAYPASRAQINYYNEQIQVWTPKITDKGAARAVREVFERFATTLAKGDRVRTTIADENGNKKKSDYNKHRATIPSMSVVLSLAENYKAAGDQYEQQQQEKAAALTAPYHVSQQLPLEVYEHYQAVDQLWDEHRGDFYRDWDSEPIPIPA